MLSGVSSNFIHPFTVDQATELFAKNVPALKLGTEPGGIIMWVARLPHGTQPFESVDMDGTPTGNEDIIGSVQLAFHVAPNGRFRSEVRKLLVDERYQRRGIGRTLMLELEKTAKENGSTLCVSSAIPSAQKVMPLSVKSSPIFPIANSPRESRVRN